MTDENITDDTTEVDDVASGQGDLSEASNEVSDEAAAGMLNRERDDESDGPVQSQGGASGRGGGSW